MLEARMRSRVLVAGLSVGGAVLLGIAAVDWVLYQTFIISLGWR